jgi:hypothetical protein
LFQDSQFGSQQGGAPVSLWLADSLARTPVTPQDWRSRLRDWADEVELVPDLGQRIGSLTWFRGLASAPPPSIFPPVFSQCPAHPARN